MTANPPDRPAYRLATVVNGDVVECDVPGRLSLADFLREELGLTSVKLGCEQGACGACTVHLDGEPVRSCIVLAAQAEQRRVTTVEGLGDDEALHPLQAAFLACRAFQCGYCTSGMIMQLSGLAERDEAPDEAAISEAVGGDICRCTGYAPIAEAVRRSWRERR